ncbi:hypothetical protein NPIL_367681, partial [Nephila pilipes]
GILVFLIK